MGRIVTPTYFVEFACMSGGMTPACWNSKQSGRANAANLAAYVNLLNASMGPGGCNAHLDAGSSVVAATLRKSVDRSVVATWKAV